MTQRHKPLHVLVFGLLAALGTGGCQHDSGFEADAYGTGVDAYPFEPIAADPSAASVSEISTTNYTGTPSALSGNSYTVLHARVCRSMHTP